MFPNTARSGLFRVQKPGYLLRMKPTRFRKPVVLDQFQSDRLDLCQMDDQPVRLRNYAICRKYRGVQSR